MSASDRLAALDAFIERVNAELDDALRASGRRSDSAKRSFPQPVKSSPGHFAARLQRAADVLAGLDRLAKDERERAADAERNAAEWERNAVLAVRANDDDLAREALGRKAEDLRRQAFHQREAERLTAEAAAFGELFEAIRAAGSASTP